MASNRIVLSGSYGTRNVGDEAILTVLVNELGARGFGVDVLTFTPEATSARQPAANAVRSGVLRGSLATFNAIRNADAIVIGGGGILQDATSLRNLLFHVSRPIMAAMIGTPVVISGVGVGPLRHALSRRLTRWVCDRAASIDVRDQRSANLLETLGVPADKLKNGADFAHLLPRNNRDAMCSGGRTVIESLAAAREQGRPLIGLSLRPPVGNRSRRARLSDTDRADIETMARIADRIIDEHDAHIVFVSMYAEQDDPIAELLAGAMRHYDGVLPVSGGLPPATIKAAIAELDLMIGTRLHTLIFAACENVPFVALAYDDKVAAYAEVLGLTSLVLDRPEWTVDAVCEHVTATLVAAAEIRQQLAEGVPRCTERARQSIDRICTAARGEC
jgi:polysaccharide pyruvyl transferase CsaB